MRSSSSGWPGEVGGGANGRDEATVEARLGDRLFYSFSGRRGSLSALRGTRHKLQEADKNACWAMQSGGDGAGDGADDEDVGVCDVGDGEDALGGDSDRRVGGARRGGMERNAGSKHNNRRQHEQRTGQRHLTLTSASLLKFSSSLSSLSVRAQWVSVGFLASKDACHGLGLRSDLLI